MNLPATSLAEHNTAPPAQQDVLTMRLLVQRDFLRQGLHRLYGNTPGFDAWFQKLLSAVASVHAQRAAALCLLDAQREASPGWFTSQQMLGYCAYVDRFAGSLAGVAARIPHLRKLGVNTLHLLPFLRARNGDNDGGFAVASFEEVEPRLGSMADLEQLTGQLRAAGISLCADFVLNHVADDHPWALAAKAGDPLRRDYFYCYPDRQQPDAYEASLAQVFPEAAPGNFTRVAELDSWVWSTFYPYQWDLNYSNRAVFAEMALTLLRLANRGIEVFRLDSAAYLWKRLGTPCMNQPEAHWILQALRSLVQIAAPGVLLLAEAIVPTAELPPYFGAHKSDSDAAGRECHLAYQSSLMAASWAAIAEQNAALVQQVIEATPVLPAPASWLSYVRCHDDIGWNVLRQEAASTGGKADARLAAVSRFYSGQDGSFASGVAFQTQGGEAAHGSNGMASALLGFEKAKDADDLADAEARLLLLYGLALSFGGLPVIYMGDEFAQGNDYSPDMQAARALDSRWLQRPRFDQALAREAQNPTSLAGRTYAGLAALIAARQQLPALAADQPRRSLPMADPAVLALQRGERFLALANFSERVVSVELPEALATSWCDCLTQAPMPAVLSLAPWGMVWLRRSAALG